MLLRLIVFISVLYSPLSYGMTDNEFFDQLKQIDREESENKKIREFESLLDEGSEKQRFLVQFEVAMLALELNMIDRASYYAQSSIEIKNKYINESFYGSVIHHSHIVLGRIALLNDELKEAKEHLILSAKVTSSPDIMSFGPNMKLAEELLQKGEEAIVINYLELCKEFWELGDKKLELWIKNIKNGGVPDFGANINY